MDIDIKMNDSGLQTQYTEFFLTLLELVGTLSRIMISFSKLLLNTFLFLCYYFLVKAPLENYQNLVNLIRIWAKRKMKTILKIIINCY
ncbi:unnamed protein product [Blepharisma stoltei]|uniref:Uncharacterized protein n=1 Tax=Blepharisma stoltei TaxID=1481888 RepID=A0AAU9JKI1_9CILI|nr:unnamed protein product [Blepharisma stoltei]